MVTTHRERYRNGVCARCHVGGTSNVELWPPWPGRTAGPVGRPDGRLPPGVGAPVRAARAAVGSAGPAVPAGHRRAELPERPAEPAVSAALRAAAAPGLRAHPVPAELPAAGRLRPG